MEFVGVQTYILSFIKDLEKLVEEGNISATLRIVKLLVKYAVELKDDLQTGLAKTPTQPWKGIIPQLFCRLNHPEAYIRQSISDLLCRIAKDFPHLIIFPAVVGSQDGPTKIENMHKKNTDKDLFESKSKSQQNIEETVSESLEADLNDNNDQNTADDIDVENQQDAEQETNLDRGEDSSDESEDEEEIVNEEKKVELKNSYKYLLDTLAENSPKMIDEVKLFVHEMRRITLLREELWIGTLNQIR